MPLAVSTVMTNILLDIILRSVGVATFTFQFYIQLYFSNEVAITTLEQHFLKSFFQTLMREISIHDLTN
jgi:hypothetical protein